jgi:hypothetical protein
VASSKFFEERSDQSEIKARIVQKYFFAWARVIIPSAKKGDGKIAYIDLYAGPGRYKDGAASTPLLVLEKATEDKDLSQMLVSMFNDVDKERSDTLANEIAALPKIEKLKYKPVVRNNAVAQDAEDYFIWMGVSVENADYVWRIDHLRHSGAAVKFLSLEPLLGPLEHLDLRLIDWAIVGGESGPGARPVAVEWIRSIRDQCRSSDVAFHFKQWGGSNKKRTGRVLDGRTWDELPARSASRTLDLAIG